MASFTPKDKQDVMFLQILSSLFGGDNFQGENLTLGLGDYSQKIIPYSKMMRNKLELMIKGPHVNNSIGAFCASLFCQGLYHFAHLIYCLGSHDHYVDGFTFGFLYHFIINQWSHSDDIQKRVLNINERDLNILHKVIMGIGESQMVKLAENIHQLVPQISKEQFEVILYELRSTFGFSLRNVKEDLFIELANRIDDGLLSLITNDILSGEHGHGVEGFTVLGTEKMSNLDVGFSFMLYVIPQALKKLHLQFEQSVTLCKNDKANEILDIAHKIVHFAIQVFTHDPDEANNHLTELWHNIDAIHSWDSISKPIYNKYLEMRLNHELKEEKNLNDSLHVSSTILDQGNSSDDEEKRIEEPDMYY